MADVTRLGFMHNNVSSQYELRRYTAYDTFLTIATVSEAAAGLVMDTTDREWKFRVVLLGATTSTTLQLSAWISGIPIFLNVSYPDFLASADTNNRAPGFEVLHTTAGSATTYLAIDEFVFDDLITADAETEPALVSEPTLTPVTPGTEGAATGTTPVTPDFGELVTARYFVNRTETEAGYSVTWAQFLQGRKLWRLHHDSLTAAEFTTLTAFLLSHNGGATAWTYDTPEAGTVKVCFVDQTFEFERRPSPSTGAVYRCAYVVEELM